jgi:hypothetical protein
MGTERRIPLNRMAGFSRTTDFGELHFDPVEYDANIVQYGIACELRRATICPCLRIETHNARASCPLCGGNGWLWPKDMREQTITLIQQRRPTTHDEPAGNVVVGTVQISFPLGVVPGEGDMLLPKAETHAVHQVLFRESLQVSSREAWNRVTSPTARPPKLGPQVDRLLYPDAEIDRIHWLDTERPSTEQLVVGREFMDFRIVDGRVRWEDGLGPKPGMAYAVRYTAPACYILLPGEARFRSDTEDVLPYMATGIRLDRWGFPDPRDL